MSDRLYVKNLVNFSGKHVGNNEFWLPVFRSTRTFTPVTCPWATWYFLWSMNRSRNRKICACCWGNSGCCWSVFHCAVSLILPWASSAQMSVWISCLSPGEDCKGTSEPSFLAFPSEFLSAVSFRKLKWFLRAHLYSSCVKNICSSFKKEVFSVYPVYLETCECSLGEYGFPDGGQLSLGLSLDFVLEIKAPLKVS